VFLLKKLVIAILLLGFLFSLSGKEAQQPQKFSRTQTEWFSLAFIGGNYGAGANISWFTVRAKYFYSEILRFQFSMTPVGRFSINMKTMIGIPLFLTKNNAHELRFGAGFSAGYSVYENPKYSFFQSFFNIPLEISYIFHIAKHFSLQFGIIIDLPLFFDDSDQDDDTDISVDTGYHPLINGFIGFRI